MAERTGAGIAEMKARLTEATRMDRRLDALAERLRRYRALGALGGRVVELEALERETAERVEAFAALARRTEAAIDRLADPLQREVLRYRYMNGWSWRTIAARTGFSREWLWRVHTRALTALAATEGEGRTPGEKSKISVKR